MAWCKDKYKIWKSYYIHDILFHKQNAFDAF